MPKVKNTVLWGKTRLYKITPSGIDGVFLRSGSQGASRRNEVVKLYALIKAAPPTYEVLQIRKDDLCVWCSCYLRTENIKSKSFSARFIYVAPFLTYLKLLCHWSDLGNLPQTAFPPEIWEDSNSIPGWIMSSKRKPSSCVIPDQDSMLIICSSLKTKQQSAKHMCACTCTHAHTCI